MQCRICGGREVIVEYNGYIRDGAVGTFTKDKVKMFRCKNCGTIWHNAPHKDLNLFYESDDYRRSLEGTAHIHDFHKAHDAEVFDKFIYTGMDCFRDKIVADIGCGGGGIIDYLNTVADTVIAIEPMETYRREMEGRGFQLYPYVKDALMDWDGKVDTVLSFDVIEHVEDPVLFLKEAYKLLKNGGSGVIGTPTDAPVMRELLGEQYESFLFSTQHPWVLGECSFAAIADHCGVKKYSCQYYQRYGMGNFIYWLLNKKPGKHFQYDFVTKTLDKVWKSELEAYKKADYIVFYFNK